MSKSFAEPLGAMVLQESVERIWSRLTGYSDEANFRNARVLVLGCEAEERASLRDSLRQIGVKVVAVAASSTKLPNLAEMGKSFTHVIFNVDAQDSVDDAVTALMDFRRRLPDVVVIAVSFKVGADDHGQERNAICDTTLRLPVTERRLRLGMLRGMANRMDALKSGRDLGSPYPTI